MKIAALYARVSSDRQQQQGTIASQLAALEQFAREKDYQVAPQHVFQDDGYSGERLDRPALEPCPNRTVIAETLEELVWRSVSELLRDPKLLVEQYQLRAQTSDETPAQQEHRRLARKLQALKREDERLIDAFQAGILELEILKERRVRIAEEVSRQETLQAALRTQIEQQERQQSLLTSLEEFRRGIQASLDNPSYETKQKILRLVVDKIEFKENEIGIKHLIPISNARLQPYRLSRAF